MAAERSDAAPVPAAAAPTAADAAALGEARAEARRRVRELRSLYLGMVAYAIVIPLLWLVNLGLNPARLWAQWPTLGAGIGLAAQALVTLAGGSFFGAQWQRRKVAELMARERLRVVSGEKQAVQAQLRLLQAQIEPHFLFNTLATIQAQVSRCPERAHRMLEQLIGHLRQSLAASRAETGTLAQEFERLGHYLELMGMRMGERLTFTLALDPALGPEPLAPMLLQPLVENAIRHGLEPKIVGGRLDVRAAPLDARRLAIVVDDDGLGFGANPDSAGTGLGLAHVRERLALLYDGDATITVADAEPGTRITIELPRRGGTPA